MAAPVNPFSAAAPAFTGITIPGGPGSAAFNSMLASLNSLTATMTALQTPTTATDTITTATDTPTSADIPSSTTVQLSQSSDTLGDSSVLSRTDSLLTSAAQSSGNPTTLVTSSVLSNAAASTTIADTASSTAAADAASTASGQATIPVSHKCNSISCSPGLQAAVAVPVVVGVIAIIAIIFLCMRRRRKQARDSERMNAAAEKQPGKKRWSRHLRVFSFDAELLMGGRHSSTNSLRSRETQSVQSGAGALGSTRPAASNEPSLHSIEEAAPPYRPTGSPSRRLPIAAGAAAIGPSPLGRDRPPSRATAPPSYKGADSISGREPHTPISTTNRNPFSDSALAVNNNNEGSLFGDSTEDQNGLLAATSRDSSRSRIRGDGESGVSSMLGSEAPSIHQAQVVRSMSVASGGKAYVAKINRTSGGSGTASKSAGTPGSMTPPKP